MSCPRRFNPPTDARHGLLLSKQPTDARHGLLPLHWATLYQQEEVVKYLVREKGIGGGLATQGCLVGGASASVSACHTAYYLDALRGTPTAASILTAVKSVGKGNRKKSWDGKTAAALGKWVKECKRPTKPGA